MNMFSSSMFSHKPEDTAWLSIQGILKQFFRKTLSKNRKAIKWLEWKKSGWFKPGQDSH